MAKSETAEKLNDRGTLYILKCLMCDEFTTLNSLDMEHWHCGECGSDALITSDPPEMTEDQWDILLNSKETK